MSSISASKANEMAVIEQPKDWCHIGRWTRRELKGWIFLGPEDDPRPAAFDDYGVEVKVLSKAFKSGYDAVEEVFRRLRRAGGVADGEGVVKGTLTILVDFDDKDSASRALALVERYNHNGTMLRMHIERQYLTQKKGWYRVRRRDLLMWQQEIDPDISGALPSPPFQLAQRFMAKYSDQQSELSLDVEHPIITTDLSLPMAPEQKGYDFDLLQDNDQPPEWLSPFDDVLGMEATRMLVTQLEEPGHGHQFVNHGFAERQRAREARKAINPDEVVEERDGLRWTAGGYYIWDRKPDSNSTIVKQLEAFKEAETTGRVRKGLEGSPGFTFSQATTDYLRQAGCSFAEDPSSASGLERILLTTPLEFLKPLKLFAEGRGMDLRQPEPDKFLQYARKREGFIRDWSAQNPGAAVPAFMVDHPGILAWDPNLPPAERAKLLPPKKKADEEFDYTQPITWLTKPLGQSPGH